MLRQLLCSLVWLWVGSIHAAPCGGIWCDESIYFPGTWQTTHYDFTGMSIGGDEPYTTPDGMVSWIEWRRTSAPEAGAGPGQSQHFYVRGEYPLGAHPPSLDQTDPSAANARKARALLNVLYSKVRAARDQPATPSYPRFQIKKLVAVTGVRGEISAFAAIETAIGLFEQSPDIFFDPSFTVPLGTGLTFALFSKQAATDGDLLSLYFQGHVLGSGSFEDVPVGGAIIMPVDFAPYEGQTGVLSALLSSTGATGAAITFLPNFYALSSQEEFEQVVLEFGASAVPEPETYALMLAGLCLLGAAVAGQKRGV